MSDDTNEKGKVIICRCHDVTYEEIANAIKAGFTTIEELKRTARIAGGECQGRTCVPLVLQIIRELTGKSPEEAGWVKKRPPIAPIPAGILAAAEEDEEDE